MGTGRIATLLTIVLSGLYLRSSDGHWPSHGGFLVLLTFNYIMCVTMVCRPASAVVEAPVVPEPEAPPAPAKVSEAPVQRYRRVDDGTWAAVHADGQQTLYTVESSQPGPESSSEDEPWLLYDPKLGHPPR